MTDGRESFSAPIALLLSHSSNLSKSCTSTRGSLHLALNASHFTSVRACSVWVFVCSKHTIVWPFVAWGPVYTLGLVCGLPGRCAAGCAVAAALIMSEARRQRMAKFGCSGDLTYDEARVLKAAMLLKQRGSRAVQWHPLWREAFLQASASSASLTAPLQQIRTPCSAG